MSQIVEKLADLTAVRDRDTLDATLMETLSDMVLPQKMVIYRIVGDAGNERLLVAARLEDGHLSSDHPQSRLDTLPRISSRPLCQQAASVRQIVHSESGSGPSVTIFPLAGCSGCVGLMELETAEPLSKEMLRLVIGVLRLYLNFQSLLDHGERDALTELLNRKSFDGAFMKATIKKQLSEIPPENDRREAQIEGNYWLAMIDIDHFKRVNDTYGHLIGDEVLLLLARQMRACFRFHDQLYRFGGEEFLVLMHCSGESEIKGALQRLRTSVEKYNFPQAGHITISIGFSEVRAGDTPGGAFERADKALYHAKGNGRNQVCSYASLVAEGLTIDQAINAGEMELF